MSSSRLYLKFILQVYGVIRSMQATLPITIKIIFEKDSSYAAYVAYSPELDVASAGPNEEVAKKNLREAINLVLKGAKEDGNLAR